MAGAERPEPLPNGEIPNRTFTVVFGTDGTGTIDLEVAKWRDVDLCG